MIKVKPFILGMPLFELGSLVILAFVLSYIVYPALIAYIASAILIAYFYGKRLKREYTVSFDGPTSSMTKLRVKGLPNNFDSAVKNLIADNKLVKISCPNNQILRQALKERIYRQAGFVEFSDSKEFQLEGAELGARCVLLSYRSKPQLQDAISTMLQRGWTIEGEQGVERTLIDSVYTQSMVYSGSSYAGHILGEISAH